MRYELSDYEWTAIKPMLPNKPRGVRRVNDRRVLSGIFWVLRSGAPWRDLPETYGPRTTCYNRFVRWRRAGVWDRIMDALAAGPPTNDVTRGSWIRRWGPGSTSCAEQGSQNSAACRSRCRQESFAIRGFTAK